MQIETLHFTHSNVTIEIESGSGIFMLWRSTLGPKTDQSRLTSGELSAIFVDRHRGGRHDVVAQRSSVDRDFDNVVDEFE